MARKQSYWWQYKSWKEVVDHAKNKCDIAILPLGSIEQHGHHLPTGHDTLQLFPMLEKIAEKTDVMLLPTPWFGAHPHHHWNFPGTVPLSNDTLDKLKDVVRGAAIAGFNKFILFFGHGQAFVTHYSANDLGKEGYFVLSVMFQSMVRDVQLKIFETPFWHADETETSIALAHFPEYVDMSQAVDMTATSLVGGDFVAGCTDYAESKPLRFDSGTVSMAEYKDLKNKKGELIGVVGKPSLANADKGARYTEEVVNRTIKLINRIKEKHPIGVKPIVN